jgi:hypothetical protein
MDFTLLESAAEISTHDLFILIKSSNRRSSSAVHWLPRCPAMSLPCLPCFFLHDGITTNRLVSNRPPTAWARRFNLLAISLCSLKYIDDRAQAPEPFVDEIKGILEPRRRTICLHSPEQADDAVRGAGNRPSAQPAQRTAAATAFGARGIIATTPARTARAAFGR